VAALNEQPVWMKLTPEIQALDDRTILVEEGDSLTTANVSVGTAHPDGPEAGKCSVALHGLPGIGNLEWTNAGESTASEQIQTWQRYLSPEALELIGENPDGAQFGELRIVIPPD
jgi:hypothetical protein